MTDTNSQADIESQDAAALAAEPNSPDIAPPPVAGAGPKAAKKGISLKQTLFAMNGVLGILLVGIAGFLLYGAQRDQHNAAVIEEIDIVANKFLASAGNWAVERGVTFANLQAPQPASADVFATIQGRRAKGDATFKAGLAAMAHIDNFHGKAELISETKALHDKAVAMRTAAENALRQPLAQRDKEVLKNWVPTMTRLIVKSQELRGAISRQAGELNGHVANLLAIKHFSWVMAEFAGRERAVMGGLVTKSAHLGGAKLNMLSRFRGELELAWDRLRNLGHAGSTPKEIKDAIEVAKTGFFEEFEGVRKSVYAAGENSARYPMQSGEWIGAATKAINSLLELRGAVSKAWTTQGVNPFANRISDLLIVAAGNWAVERGVTFSGLNGAQPAAQQMLGVIKKRRGNADKAFNSAMSEIAGGPAFAGRAKMLNDLRGAHAKALTMRRRADTDLAKPKSGRDADLLKQWVPTMTGLILTSQALRVAATSKAAAESPVVGDFVTLKHNAWMMAEFAGRERAAMGGVIAAQSRMSAARVRTLATYRGRVESGWDVVQRVAASAGMPQEVRQSVTQLRKVYFGEFEKTRLAVYQAATGSAAYPVKPSEWIAAASKAINSLLHVGEVAGKSTEHYAQKLSAEASTTMLFAALLMLVGVGIVALAFWVTAKRVAGPINNMTDVMMKLADGDKGIEIPTRDRHDEIGSMAQAVQVFKENMIENDRLQEEQRKAEVRAEEDKRQAMMELADGLEQSVGKVIEGVSSAANQMQASANQMTGTAAKTSELATAVAAASDQATANVQTVSTATDELSSAIQEIGRQVAQSADIATNAVREATATNENIQALAEGAQRIGDVLTLITDIASQTNLLALNATIEAARAGEAGKGFAVVASEVKSLADQTAKATDEIAGQIGQIQTGTTEAVTAIQGIGKTIDQINDIATAIASAVEEQGAATNEIAGNVSQAATGTQEVTTNIGEVTTATAETGEAAKQVLSAAEDMAKQSTELRTSVDEFLVKVRAA